MARVEDSPWAIPVAQIASRAGQSKPIDADFPAPSGIGDSIVGIKEGEPVHVSGQFDSIVDGLIFTGRLVAPFVSECTRCLKPIDEDWPVDVTVFFPYESGQDKANGKGYAHSERPERFTSEIRYQTNRRKRLIAFQHYPWRHSSKYR